ncbi:unnamed protein product [Cylindrotheca closterium]|uniref:Uncharacterized protein n=1 Tax=Cylindrotheca closterium TaxID=2856 RepID=A0AAD2CJF2_9STRA|nr:unnamed protein product [Cylindrotheca closterium]
MFPDSHATIIAEIERQKHATTLEKHNIDTKAYRGGLWKTCENWNNIGLLDGHRLSGYAQTSANKKICDQATFDGISIAFCVKDVTCFDNFKCKVSISNFLWNPDLVCLAHKNAFLPPEEW